MKESLLWAGSSGETLWITSRSSHMLGKYIRLSYRGKNEGTSLFVLWKHCTHTVSDLLIRQRVSHSERWSTQTLFLLIEFDIY